MATTSNSSHVTKGVLTHYDSKMKDWTKKQIPSTADIEQRVTTVETAYRAAEKSISDIDDTVNGESGVVARLATVEAQVAEEMTVEDVDALFAEE